MKINMKTRLIALGSALILAFSLFGCQIKTSDESGKDLETSQPDKQVEVSTDPMVKYEPPITVTTVKSLDDAMQQMQGVKEDVLTNNNWINSYKEELGINVEYEWTVPGSQYEQKINTQIAANDLPDFFPVTANQMKLLVDSGMVADLSQTFADNATEFTQQMMEDDNHVAISQATYGNKLMALPQVNGNRDGASMMWIRQDWLDNLGKEAPKTMDELMKLAAAFTNEDPDKNGVNDTYGIALNKDVITGGLNDATGIFEGFGAYVNGWLKNQDGKLVFGLVQPEIKDGLEALSTMYENGYLDKEFSAKDNSKASEDIIGGKAGITFGQHWIAFWPLQDAINANPDADWVAYSIPSATSSPAKVMVHGSTGSFYAVNVNAKNPEAIVKLYNYFYQKDCALSPDYDSKYHVTSTLMMERPDEAFQWSAITSMYPMQNLFIHRGVKEYFDGDKSVLENAWISDNALQCEQYVEDPVANQSLWASYRWSGPESAFTVVDYYDTNSLMLQNEYIMGNTDSMMQYNTTLNQLTLETFTKIIMGSSPIDEFDTFVEQWYNLGGEAITEEVSAIVIGQ